MFNLAFFKNFFVEIKSCMKFYSTVFINFCM